MNLGKSGHLTYCTNIHPGETWEEVFNNLRDYILPLKQKVSPNKPFGIGLRLSNQATCDLIKDQELNKFKAWLNQHQLYVFTMNGFPYGGFHGKVVKDKVHFPDWTTRERIAYTLRLCKILCQLLPEGMDGGISTSPISYKPWIEAEEESREKIMNSACDHLFLLIEELAKMRQATGKIIHIDIEPEPDGLIENSEELIEFFNFYLIPDGKEYLIKRLGITSSEAKQIIKDHIQACYDVCHHAIAYETPSKVFLNYEKAGIKIGKIQISAALKVLLEDENQRQEIELKLRDFEESTYLHQVIERGEGGRLKQYPDLPLALNNIMDAEAKEWRVHFHVPIFVDNYNLLLSTQQDIIDVLNYHKSSPVTAHLEVETYTWDVLPSDLKSDLLTSIQRELEWVIERLNN